MEVNAAETEVDSVLSARKRPQESQSEVSTPVAKKTRASVRQRSKDEDLQNALSKTPLGCIQMTPRRSARKSVRPQKDYEDIVEGNGLRSASKHSKDVDAEAEDSTAHKWEAAQVGRHSRKRRNKSKSGTSKSGKKKKEEEKSAMDVEEQKRVDEEKENVEEQEEIKKDSAEVEEKTTEEDQLEPQSPVKEQSCKENNIASIPKSSSPNSNSNIATKCSEATLPVGVNIEDLDELGLSPLIADDNDKPKEEEDNDEMPSLLLNDDEDLADDLNRTFEVDTEPIDPPLKAVDQQAEEKEPNELDVDMPRLQMSPEKPIKIVLTDENEQDQTILKMDDKLESSKIKAYRFPTPMKKSKSSKMNFKFGQHLEVEVSPHLRRRSKSVCGVRGEKKKNVCFISPVEITDVDDIDKRWEKLNISNVTQRRRRSKSLDIPLAKSRIPKPKFFPLKIPTPVKLNTRTKLPNFAAIHQRQFNKMENLVDHMERKAVRAKELTSASKKSANGTASSAQKSSTKKLINADRSRPQAQKKIIMPPSDPLTPLKSAKKNHPTPRKIEVSQVTKSRLPLLTKSVTNVFSTMSSVAAPSNSFNKKPPPAAAAAISAPRTELENKLEARRQRHMQMFKGRNTKAKENSGNIILGVRSNRRFELQMQHRRQMNTNNNNNN